MDSLGMLTVLLAPLLIVFNEAEAEVLGRRWSTLVFIIGVIWFKAERSKVEWILIKNRKKGVIATQMEKIVKFEMN